MNIDREAIKLKTGYFWLQAEQKGRTFFRVVLEHF